MLGLNGDLNLAFVLWDKNAYNIKFEQFNIENVFKCLFVFYVFNHFPRQTKNAIELIFFILPTV